MLKKRRNPEFRKYYFCKGYHSDKSKANLYLFIIVENIKKGFKILKTNCGLAFGFIFTFKKFSNKQKMSAIQVFRASY